MKEKKEKDQSKREKETEKKEAALAKKEKELAKRAKEIKKAGKVSCFRHFCAGVSPNPWLHLLQFRMAIYRALGDTANTCPRYLEFI